MRYFAGFWAVAFIIFAALQFNDPDPFTWIALYLFAAALSVFAMFKKYYKIPVIAGMVVYLVWALYLFPANPSEWLAQEEQAKSLAMKMPFVEEARESLGLLIAFAVLTVYLFASTQTDKRRRRI